MCAPKKEGGIGFRDLKAFNIALLAKQGWQLQTCPNSLFHWVYKAKYFPYGDFLNASWGDIHLTHGVVLWLHKRLFN